MNKSNEMAYVKSLFESYPSVNEFHFTKDSNAFEQKHNADSHATNLDAKNPEVFTITRMDLAKWESEWGVKPVPTDFKQKGSAPLTSAESGASAESVPTVPRKEDTAVASSDQVGASTNEPVTPATDAKATQTTSKKK
jgi:hypothetical protein